MIRGNLVSLHLGDLLQWLTLGGLSGRLSVTSRGYRRDFHLARGQIVGAVSQAPVERTPPWLVGQGLISADQARRSAARAMLQGKTLGEVLVDSGDVDAETLRLALSALAEVMCQHLLIDSEATFAFDPGFPTSAAPQLELRLDPTHMVLGAARLSDEATSSPEFDAKLLPYEGEDWEKLFWKLAFSAFGDELTEVREIAELNAIVRDLVGVLGQWVDTSPGLVSMPPNQLTGLAEGLLDKGKPRFENAPHLVWNLAVIQSTVPGAQMNDSIELAALVDRLELDLELASARRWVRTAHPAIDRLGERVGRGLAQAAAAAAASLGGEPRRAALLAQLYWTPSDVVLYLLSSLEPGSTAMRKAILEELPRRLGRGLARAAALPDHVAGLFDEHPEHTVDLDRLSLEIARRTVAGASVLAPLVELGDEETVALASPEAIGAALDAARRAAESAES